MRKMEQAERQAGAVTDEQARGQAELGRVYAYLLARRARRLAGETTGVTDGGAEEKGVVPPPVALVPTRG